MPSFPALFQKLDDVGAKAEKDHKRLRDDLDRATSKIEDLEETQGVTLGRLHKLETKTVEITEIRFTTGTLVSVVAGCLMIAAGMWQIDSRSAQRQQDIAFKQQVQGERISQMISLIEALDRKYELQRGKIEDLKQDVLKMSR